MRGTLDILPMGIFVNDNSMEKIISIKEVADYLRVTMDTKEDHTMLVHYSKAYYFKRLGKGLYYIEISNPETIPLTTESGNTDYYLLSTVNANMEYFTHADIEGANISRDLQHLLGCPSNQQLINTLSKKLIINCPVLLYDVRRYHVIYGPATAILKGKMVRHEGHLGHTPYGHICKL